MKTNNILKIVIIVAIFFSTISIVYYFVIFLPSSTESSNMISNTLRCNELFKIKQPLYKEKYWIEGEGEVIFSPKLNSCLAINLHLDSRIKGVYTGSVINMSDDSEILSYIEKLTISGAAYYFDENDKKIECKDQYNSLEYSGYKKYGCDKPELYDEMINQIIKLGFKSYDRN